MPRFAAQKLSDAEVASLEAYIASFPAPSASELPTAPDANATGAKLYDSSCSMCHGPEGRGLMGPGILNSPVSLADFTTQVHNGGKTMPPFPQLSNSDVQAIYAYLHPAHTQRADAAVGNVVRLPGSPKRVVLSLAVLVLLLVIFAVVVLNARQRLRRRFERERAQDARIAAELGDSERISVRTV
jgi:mono/diheme cytochrome c family protein